MGGEAMTVTLSGDAADKLRRLSEASGHDPASYLGVMLDEYFEADMAEIAELKRRIADVEENGGLAHEDVVAEIRAMLDSADKRRTA
ncbi:hypothetical protein [Jiella sonneratiae]|uniref:CopG family transcriptional regulator n=1 Tax=Jiella sonneratiae TaxID=2816856 RepID=A0ABS3J408_9HYPH|nr:hypothetical protein [Jiella sonneratiae]MBO0903698.1 hypothetical protein [Jiella sonneratiae]